MNSKEQQDLKKAQDDWNRDRQDFLMNMPAESAAKPVSEDVDLDIVIELFERFMPENIAIDSRKELSMYDAYHRIKKLKASGYAAAPAKGMKWVKASERLPDETSYQYDGLCLKVTVGNATGYYSPDEKKWYYHNDFEIRGDDLKELLWLDESPSDSEAGDAVEFAEFVTQNYSFIVSSGYYAKSEGYRPLQDITWYTTSELYHQFKKQ